MSGERFERRALTFASPWAKAKWLDAAARLDARWPGPRLRAIAAELARLPSPSARAVAIHRRVRDGIAYVRDPDGREELADAETVAARGFDDCDGKSRLVVALALLAGIEARIRPVFKGSRFVHVQSELRWPGSKSWPGAAPDGWVLCETILRGVELGQGSEAARLDAAGVPLTTDPPGRARAVSAAGSTRARVALGPGARASRHARRARL